MKKFLLKAAIALLFGGILISCTHDTDASGSSTVNSEDLLKTYEQAFLNTFDRPVNGINWGFGNNEPVVASSRALTRAIQPSFNFPSDADSKKFLKNVPQGVETLTQNVAQANNWIDESWTGEINIWGQWDGSKNIGGTLYIKGDCDFSNRKFYFAGNSELYLLEGATLTLNAENAGNLQTGCNIYIAKNAKIVTPAELKLNNGLHIYNHGTIEANKLSTNSNSWLVNSGTVNVTTKISVENELSVIENNGTIKAADINTAGSGKFENNGNVTISGTTFINSNNNTWVNNGKYKTGNFIYEAASDEVINNCMLTVDEDFNMNLGDNPGNGNFKMDAGAGVETKYFNGGGNWAKNYSTGWNYHNGGPFYIYMGENSVFKVTETATMNATKADYGIYGPSDGGFAVFQAKKIEAGKDGQGYEVTYGNNLYVAAESHFANGLSGSYPYIDIKGNAKVYAPGFEDGKPAITISATTCNPGFTGDSGSGSAVLPANPSKVRVIAEDLSTNYNNGKDRADFDYNDVVFDVQKSGNNLKITLKAAGGTLPLTIGGAEGETEKDLSEQYDVLKYEVHRLFKVSTGTMVNTNAPNGITRDDVVFEIPMPEGVSSSDNLYNIANSIPIRVLREGVWTTLPVATPVTESSLTAAKLAVDDTYNWCDERVNINNKFPYTDKNGVSRDPRFKLYLNGQLTGKWWLETNRLAGD